MFQAVHKGRVSKRVHHIANLTTALTVLRRRGLELINNNAADIADGNPRIVLGLVWQIILHFQVSVFKQKCEDERVAGLPKRALSGPKRHKSLGASRPL